MLSPDQKFIRQNGLTGSEMAAVCALSPWAKPIDVYASKVHQSRDVDWQDSDALIRGTLFEAPVLQWYGIKSKRQLVSPRQWAGTPTDTLTHPEHPIVIATPDAISRSAGSEPDIIVEVKCPGWRMAEHWGEEGTDEIPEYYRPQVMWEMAVTGLTVAHVVAYLGDAPRIYRVDWDQELFDALLQVAERFWHDHILARRPPPVDGSDSYDAWIAQQYPANRVSTYLDMDATIEPWVRRLKRLRGISARIKEAQSVCEQRIQLFIGDAAGLKCGELGRIDYKKNKDGERVDIKRLRAENEDLVKAYAIPATGARPFFPRFAKGA